MNAKVEADFMAANNRRTDARTSLAAVAVSASCDLLDSQACAAQRVTLQQARAAAIAAAKPEDVIAIDSELLRVNISAEIAEARAAASAARHAAAVAELHQAEAAVTEAAQHVLLEEMVTLAHEFTAALDSALEIGGELEALSMPLGSAPPLPRAVTAALERLPKPNPLDVPIHLLRSGVHSNAWGRRLAELTADHEPIDVSVAA